MATKYATNLIPDMTVAQRVRDIVTFVDALLVTTGGWLNTGDTGQTAPASFPAVTAANQKVGYRCYKMNDALQATAPVFMRLDFGGGGGGVGNALSIWVTIGTGSDGAGNITGVCFNNVQIQNPSNNGAIATNSYGSADPSRVQMALFVQTTNVQQLIFIISIERSKDASGNDTGDAILISYIQGGSTGGVSYSNYIVLAGGAQPATEQGITFICSSNNPTASCVPGDVGVGVMIHFKGVSQQPGIGLLAALTNDVSAEGTFNATIYGVTHTYLQTRQGFGRAGNFSTFDTTTRCCIRYD